MPANSDWMVYLTCKAAKQAAKLPEEIFAALAVLQAELQAEGPVQQEWPNYGKLKGKKGDYHHCHLNKVSPAMLQCGKWKILPLI